LKRDRAAPSHRHRLTGPRRHPARRAGRRPGALRGRTSVCCAERNDELTVRRFGQLLTGEPEPKDVDLLVPTGGEQRLSDFLLWESAYAELYFTERMWPGFGAADLAAALAWFRAASGSAVCHLSPAPEAGHGAAPPTGRGGVCLIVGRCDELLRVRRIGRMLIALGAPRPRGKRLDILDRESQTSGGFDAQEVVDARRGCRGRVAHIRWRASWRVAKRAAQDQQDDRDRCRVHGAHRPARPGRGVGDHGVLLVLVDGLAEALSRGVETIRRLR